MIPLLTAITFIFLGTQCAGESTLVAGGAGWALRFDGVNDFVLLEEELPPEPWTIEMWVKPESLTNGDGTSLVNFNMRGTLLCRTSMVGGDMILQVAYNGEQVWYGSTNQIDIHTDEVTPTTAVGQLYHWALTKTENSSKVFINGVLAAEEDLVEQDYPEIHDLVSTPWLLGARMVLVGRKWITDDRNFGGIIDEVRWWKGERSEAQLREHMHRPVPDGEPDLITEWSFSKKDGNSLVGSYYLGGGNDFNAPSWVPSPVTSHGGSIAISTRAAASGTYVAACAILTPADAGATATFSLLGASYLGTLTPATSIMTETLEGAPLGSTRFCANVTFEPSNFAGFEEVPFEVRATLSDDGATELTSTQNISIFTSGNSPPSAGAASAVTTDGVENYLSLGSWEMTDDWSMSVWVDPISYVNDVWILSQHSSEGTNMFRLGFYGIGYFIQLSCFVGCSESASITRNYPDVGGDVLVLNSGRTADEIDIRRMEPHHVALTFHCVTRGDATTPALGILKVYQDGLLIGHDEWPLCYQKPLLPEGYEDEDWAARPAPWEMGEEYDSGDLDEHLENVAVVPSNFMHATFDEFVVWNATLTDSEVLANAQGSLVRIADINVRYTFDLDDEEDCLERQLWDKTLNCYGLNEANGTTAPSTFFPWTNAAIGEVDRDPSPFYLVAGSPVYKSVAAGTCAVATLQGADADGDSLTFSLVTTSTDTPTRNLTLEGSELTLCDSDAGATDVQFVTIQYDACDDFGDCASATSALGTVIFHILPRGPSILAFQALTKDRVVRIVFDTATNCPTVTESADLSALFLLSDDSVEMRGGDWEEGCQALRISLEDSSRLFDTSATELTATILYGGMLRDEAEVSYPSIDTSPNLVSLTCGDNELLLPGVVECATCPAGYSPAENVITGVDECQPCQRGTAGEGECASCIVGTYANTTAVTECFVCPVGYSCSDFGMETPVACSAGMYQSEVGKSSCSRCPRGQYSNDTGSSSCSACPTGKTTEGTGFASLDDCTCPANTYQYDDRCVSCGAGATCEGFGSEPKADFGYQLFAIGSDRLDLFRCASEPLRCPGGLVGTCAPGRTGIACADCLPHRTPDSDGSCSPCEGSDWAVFIVILCLVIGAVGVLYWRISVHDTIRMKHEALLMMTTTAQILFVLQASAVLSRLSVEWPDPMLSFYKFVAIFTFDLNVLRIGCVAAVSELTVYLTKLLLIPAFVVGISLCHFVSSMVRGKHFLADKQALLGSIGIFVTSFYAALTSAISSPFQCLRHPNDRWSMTASEGMICWEGGEHKTMIVCAILALSMLFGFFAWVVRLIQVYPKRMAAGDVRFLNTYSFLFLRVRPAARWYVVLFLARNGVIALIPAIPNAFWQAFSMIVAFAVSAGTTLYALPWRLMPANFFDVFTCALLQGVIIIAIPFVASTEDVRELPKVALVLVLMCFAAAPVLLLRWILGRVANRQKAYRWFLCHQKASAGAFARMLKLYLVERYARGVFLDSDDLVDLSKLFRLIECDTENLVPLCTQEILSSPWCLGEIAVSTLFHIKLLPVYFPDFQPPTELLIEQLEERVTMNILTESGLTLQDVKGGLRNLSCCKFHELPAAFDEVSIINLMDDLSSGQELNRGTAAFSRLRSSRSTNSGMMHNKTSGSMSQGGTYAIVLDCGQTEALAAGFVLMKLLRPLLVNDGKPFLLRVDQPNPWSKSTEIAIILCTSGCFGSALFLHGLLLLVQHQVQMILPVVASKDFVFPQGAFYQDLEGRVAQICSEAGVTGHRELLTPFTRAMFQKISSGFSVQDSLAILETQVQIMSVRLVKNAALLTDYAVEEDSGTQEALNDILERYDDGDDQTVTLERSASNCYAGSISVSAEGSTSKRRSQMSVRVNEEANVVIYDDAFTFTKEEPRKHSSEELPRAAEKRNAAEEEQEEAAAVFFEGPVMAI